MYASKAAIYKDFPLAVKFHVTHWQSASLGNAEYTELYETLSKENCKLEEFSRQVQNLRSAYPISVGLFLEVPVKTDDGKQGVRYVLLQHESGPEFFIPPWAILAAGAIGWELGKMALKTVYDAALGMIKNHAAKVKDMGVKIDHVCIRTRNHVEMWLPFNQLDLGGGKLCFADGIGCLLRKLAYLKGQSKSDEEEAVSGPALPFPEDWNSECFGSLLITNDFAE
jgi:hypothetical protein